MSDGDDVCLVSMPYASLERPSLGLGILKAALVRRGIRARVVYANLALAEVIGLRRYHYVNECVLGGLVGEWTFAGAAFPEHEGDAAGYLRECARRGIRPEVLTAIREQVGPFVERVAAELAAARPAIVGCSSTFEQHCASLALLRRLKELRPETVTMLGGANCEGPMGRATHRAFPWVDYVVSGDADELLPELCERVLLARPELPTDALPAGVLGPARGAPSAGAGRAVVEQLDGLPLPDFDDYHAALGRSTLGAAIRPGIPFEAARGCWWGQRQACVFCGLSGTTTTWREKSAPRVLGELAALAERYGARHFEATDNILGRGAFAELLPALASAPERYTLLFETPASLGAAQVALLASAGIRWIQPGIESLHDEALRLLGKGTSAARNLALLKWSQQHGIHVLWNFLVGIPGEHASWYDEVLGWLPLVAHLEPPGVVSPIRFDRFSTFHEHPERFGLELTPAWPYAHVYPLPEHELAELAAVFDDRSPRRAARLAATSATIERLAAQVEAWSADFHTPRAEVVGREVSSERPRLTMREEDGSLVITDTRGCAGLRETVLSGARREVYRACDSPCRSAPLLERLRLAGSPLGAPEVTAALDWLRERGLLLSLRGAHLALAVAEPLAPLLPADEFPGGTVRIARSIWG